MNCALREEKSGDARTASTGWGTREKDGLGGQARTARHEVPLWEPLCHASGSDGKAEVDQMYGLGENLTFGWMLALGLNTGAVVEIRKNAVAGRTDIIGR